MCTKLVVDITKSRKKLTLFAPNLAPKPTMQFSKQKLKIHRYKLFIRMY